MEGVLDWGVEIIRAIQTVASPGLTAVMRALTLMGSEYFYLIFLPILFWCVDERYGARFGLVFLLSSFVNGWLKIVFAQPRPYHLDPAVGLGTESSYGLPSGHAQGTATFWGLLAPKIRRPWGLVLALAVPLVISFTRLYLGLHFPTDLFLGLALGWAFAIAGIVLGDRAARLLASWNVRVRILLAAGIALAMNALNMKDTNLSGIFFGTAVGACFLFDRLRFDASSGGFGQKALRLALGLAGVAAIYFGVKLMAPAWGEPLYALFRFVRYALVGAWVSFGAPWAFMRLGLAGARPAEG
ncbi:MAG TPA: phosphatase PAP2 family protein [Spirochaetales bacterium]|nr:phosphatase PAP2 family protein [Spirochaetales bacterium]HPG87604.1 phosphatase PAP2 family protein [Spirochaetales bacterium]HPM72183.1 phosphatase PAP2 family protein [Spirochaetales bacterium]